MKIHFIAGLPRSGSTVLSAILRQNPAFGAEMSSGLAALFSEVLRTMSLGEHSVKISVDRRRTILRSLIESYYSVVPKGHVIFDTNRSWCNTMSAVCELFPDARVICCVRSPAWVLDSMEQLFQRNPFVLPTIFGQDGWHNVYARVGKLMGPSGVVGGSMQAFAQAWYGPNRNKMITVRYESLVQRPAVALGRLYEFIGEPHFAHDFDSFEYSADEFDDRLGMPGLHRVRGPLAARKRIPILPEDLFRQYDHAFWESPGAAEGAAMV